MSEKELKFDESLKALEEIVEKLEEGDIPLEEALDRFQEGITLSRDLKKKLQNAEDVLAKIVTEDGSEEVFQTEE